MNLSPSVIIASACLIGILFRDRLGKIMPWKIMFAGTVALIFIGAVTLPTAFSYIDLNVILFLYGMFVLANGLEKTGYLYYLSERFFGSIKSPFFLLFAFVFFSAAASCLLLNDSIAILGVPVAIAFSKASGIKAKPLLIALALSITVGSVASPLGNPQNFLIASHLEQPFLAFLVYLFFPTVISLALLVVILWLFFPELRKLKSSFVETPVHKKNFFAPRTALLLVAFLSFLRIISSFFEFIPSFELHLIALAGAICFVILSRNISNAFSFDWRTLVFFAGMFVVMNAVWESGFFQQFLPSGEALSELISVVVSSLFLSQVLSNVPFVILYLKALPFASEKTLMLLAAGSTLAGGLTIFGAASNIIILQYAEKKGEALPVKDFMKVGIISSLVSLVFIFAWISFLS